jgi:hypothetical protein
LKTNHLATLNGAFMFASCDASSFRLHQRYAEFGPFLLAAWQKALGFKKDDKVSII